MLPYWEFDRWREMGRVQRIIDLRSPWQYEKERIRGSENIPYDEFWDHMDEINYGARKTNACFRSRLLYLKLRFPALTRSTACSRRRNPR